MNPDSSNPVTDAAKENARARDGDIFSELKHHGLIVVAGPDAASFMQGQFTNDIQQVTAQQSQLSAFCNNKGRMIANFTVFQYQQNYFISLHRSLLQTVVERLQQYILSAQVAVQDVTDQLVHFGLSGEAAANCLENLLATGETALPAENNAVSANQDYIVIKTVDSLPRYHVFADSEKAAQLRDALTEVASEVHDGAWDYLNIQAGLPVINASTSEAFVPQMANMELLGGVSFKKGCYTGQEIVARMHYLGKLKKRMYKIHIDAHSDTAPQSGDPVFAENASAGQNTGMLIDAQVNPDGGYDALAVLQIADSQARLKLHDSNGPVIHVEALPYSLEPEASS